MDNIKLRTAIIEIQKGFKTALDSYSPGQSLHIDGAILVCEQVIDELEQALSQDESRGEYELAHIREELAGDDVKAVAHSLFSIYGYEKGLDQARLINQQKQDATANLQAWLNEALEALSYVSGDSYGKDAKLMAHEILYQYTRDEEDCTKCDEAGNVLVKRNKHHDVFETCPSCKGSKKIITWGRK